MDIYNINYTIYCFITKLDKRYNKYHRKFNTLHRIRFLQLFYKNNIIIIKQEILLQYERNNLSMYIESEMVSKK
jgi:hypothetical protein